MRHKWEVHGREADVIELYIKFGDDWRIVGWVGPALRKPGFYAYCHWIDDGDYPENKEFETAKQAKRALKSAATVAIVGGWNPNNF
jgi:hypothetical protein